MNKNLVTRPRAIVTMQNGRDGIIGRTKTGRVGVVTRRYAGATIQPGEVWLVDVVRDYDRFFIMLPTEKVKDAA